MHFTTLSPFYGRIKNLYSVFDSLAGFQRVSVESIFSLAGLFIGIVSYIMWVGMDKS